LSSSSEDGAERRLTTQTDGVFRRFVVEMDTRRHRSVAAAPGVSAARYTNRPSSASTSSAVSASSHLAAAAAAAADDYDDDDDDDDDQLS